MKNMRLLIAAASGTIVLAGLYLTSYSTAALAIAAVWAMLASVFVVKAIRA